MMDTVYAIQVWANTERPKKHTREQQDDGTGLQQILGPCRVGSGINQMPQHCKLPSQK